MNKETFCAVIENGKVVNVVVVEPNHPVISKNPNWVFIGENPDSISPKWTYDGTNFQAPTYDLPPATKFITKIAFRFRITDAEYSDILAAAKVDTEVQVWVETFNMVSTQIDLYSPKTTAGLDLLVAKGLLTEERKVEILNAPLELNERP